MAPTRKKALVPKKGEDLKIMWTEKDMNLFKEDMSEVLNSQLNIKKSCMPKSTLRLCERWLYVTCLMSAVNEILSTKHEVALKITHNLLH